MDIPLHCPCGPKYNRLQNRKLISMCINRLKNQQSNFIDLAFFKRRHKSRFHCPKVFKQAKSRILYIGQNEKYFQMTLRSIIGNEVVFVLNHYSDKMCVVSLIGCEPVDILVVWLYRYCRWRSNYKSWVGMQFTGWNMESIRNYYLVLLLVNTYNTVHNIYDINNFLLCFAWI